MLEDRSARCQSLLPFAEAIFRLKYGLTKEEIRRDIELALEGVVKPRQVRS